MLYSMSIDCYHYFCFFVKKKDIANTLKHNNLKLLLFLNVSGFKYSLII
ncbi:hypothetical protein A1OE_587 [Candidatus Endolissoclinum faulkneri L2]|uniref:Uncharacterized protein n=1 Tax=Candidatus Endolissoclinum faulkneri L2 TaxID=1193729 RepID=K7Z440_9PROT|nr:hypothetical protein A1OE_587 [Candidatus Endolissoclinum faulkneri L2]